MKMNSDVDRRWEMIGALVESAGSEEEKIAWALCRGDAAEWRLGTKEQPMSEFDRDILVKGGKP